MFKNEPSEIVPAIVSEELWDEANEVLTRRSEDVKNRQGVCNHANLLTGKLYCAHCGAPYYRRESKDKEGTIQNGFAVIRLITARMPARDPERIMDRVIIADAANPKRRIRLLFRMTARQKGKPAERHAAKPAGLSKLPVMSNPRLT